WFYFNNVYVHPSHAGQNSNTNGHSMCVGVGYMVAAYYFVSQYQLWGMAYVTLIANSLKLSASIIFVFKNKKEKTI
ncbi:MAG: hypothetical protein IKY44_04880, partial [Clostridia bacterium]|nr:hypothetical protein [Clostridia bacterium]